MTRKAFLQQMATLGIGLPLLTPFLSSCSKTHSLFSDLPVNFRGKVLIIGAGSAGLTAGHLLRQQGIDFTILEAAGQVGGRVKKASNFAEVPIDLGAEWIHTDPSILTTILNDPRITGEIDIINYNPETLYLWKNEKLRKRNFFTHFYGEYKFKSTTWFDFFEDYIIPKIKDQILLNHPVQTIDYTGDQVVVTTDQTTFTADKVLVTVPLTILQNQSISFFPELPAEKIAALDEVEMPDGIKVFLTFSEKFYPDLLGFGHIMNVLNGEDGDRLYYDAMFGKDVNQAVLGLFSVGPISRRYTEVPTEAELIQLILTELDEIFSGKASQYYQDHIIQNWSKEPYIRGSYSHYGNNQGSVIETLAEPISDKVYFAGEAMNLKGNTSTVHGAAESAHQALERLLKT